MPATSHPSRLDRIGEATLLTLAENGARGLTHRAVDERAGLPPGSTSYYARSRSALLQLAVAHAAKVDTTSAGMTPEFSLPADPAALADQVADRMHLLVTAERVYTIARYELALEATRREELRESYDASGRQFLDVLTAGLARAGSPAPERHGRALLAWCEGVLFRSTAGARADQAPSKRELRATARDLVRAMIPAARSHERTG